MKKRILSSSIVSAYGTQIGIVEKPIEHEFVDVMANSRAVLDTLCPINPITGHRESDLALLMADDTPEIVKEALGKGLVRGSLANDGEGMTDEELIESCPSRYRTSLNEVRKDISSVVDEMEYDNLIARERAKQAAKTETSE